MEKGSGVAVDVGVEVARKDDGREEAGVDGGREEVAVEEEEV